MHISFHLVEEGEGRLANVSYNPESKKYTVNYPCTNNYNCTNYYANFPAGVYLIELYGGSAGSPYITTVKNEDKSGCSIPQKFVSEYGGNTQCLSASSTGGAGGYTSAILTLQSPTLVYIAIGGMGQYSWSEVDNGDSSFNEENRPKGGFNGGGKGSSYNYRTDLNSGASGGGGATDLRIKENDLFHRIIVAGGGGGSDNRDSDSPSSINSGDDGTGGAGGGKSAQGYWTAGTYNDKVATQTSGFSFGYGESAQKGGSKHPDGNKNIPVTTDVAGAGAGWFGGFASHHSNGGAGGGSSFVLTKDAEIPKGTIYVMDDMYENKTSGTYAFSSSSQYVMKHPVFLQGIWTGNGKAIITLLNPGFCSHQYHISLKYYLFLICFELNKN